MIFVKKVGYKIIFILISLMLVLGIPMKTGSVEAAFRSDGIYELTDAELRTAYNKYIVPNLSQKASNNALAIETSDQSTPEGHLTEGSKKKMLDVLNFIRAIYGLSPVTWDSENEVYAQAGVQYLADHHLKIDHWAADGKDATADRGLKNSSLAQAWYVYTQYQHLFAWIEDADVDSLGHRLDILSPYNTSVGMAMGIDGTTSTMYTAHYAKTDSSKKNQIVCYPSAGLVPIDTFYGFYYENPIWSISGVSGDASKLKVTVSDETGKTVNYTPGKVSSTNTQNNFTVLGGTVQINPYAFTKGDARNLLNHTYTIEVSGLDSSPSTIKYSTKVISLESYKPEIKVESECESLTLSQKEITIGVGQQKTLDINIKPANLINKIISGSSSYDIASFTTDFKNSQITIKGESVGKATVTVWSPDEKRKAEVVVNVVKNPVQEPEDSGSQSPDNTTDPKPGDQSSGNTVAVYRLYNRITAEHLYTTDQNEVNVLKSGDWTYEGIGWNSPKTGTKVFRLYSPVTGAHLFTTDTNEVAQLSSQGWSVDNNGDPLFYSGGSKDVYRLYNPVTRMHLITLDQNEYNTLPARGWNQEGAKLKAN